MECPARIGTRSARRPLTRRVYGRAASPINRSGIRPRSTRRASLPTRMRPTALGACRPRFSTLAAFNDLLLGGTHDELSHVSWSPLRPSRWAANIGAGGGATRGVRPRRARDAAAGFQHGGCPACSRPARLTFGPGGVLFVGDSRGRCRGRPRRRRRDVDGRSQRRGRGGQHRSQDRVAPARRGAGSDS